MTEESNSSDLVRERRSWLSVLACASADDLAAALSQLDSPNAVNPLNEVEVSELRAPENGLTLVTGRVGATGSPFGLGEMTVTRCVVQIGSHMGVGYVRGRDSMRAKNIAIADALLQSDRKGEVLAKVIEPLSAAKANKESKHRMQIESSRVRFLTMVRGD